MIDGAFTVRRVQAADRDGLIALVQNVRAEIVADYGNLAVPATLADARAWYVAQSADNNAALVVSFDTATMTLRGAGLWAHRPDQNGADGWELILVATDKTLPRGNPADAMTAVTRLNAYRECYHVLAWTLPDAMPVYGTVKIGGTLDLYLATLRLPGPLVFVDNGNLRTYWGTALQARSM